MSTEPMAALPEADMVRLWRKLTDPQRLYLMNLAAPHGQEVPQPHSITSGRALERLGLTYHPSTASRALAEWAKAHGYARQDGPLVRRRWGAAPVASWTFSAPESRRIDPQRLADLAAEGHHGAAIAEQLGVTREAVRVAAIRQGLTLARRSKKLTTVRPPRVLRPKRVVFHVSEGELAAIEEAAAQQGVTVSAHLRRAVFDQSEAAS